MKKNILFLLLCVSFVSFSQEKQPRPIPVEVLFGNNRSNIQFSVNKSIIGNWRYVNITSAATDYKNTHSETELVMNNHFVYQLHRNVGVSGGLQYHFLKGLVPNNAIHFSYGNRTWLCLLTQGLEYMPGLHSASSGIVEFKPHLNNHIRLYTRAQALYNHNFAKEAHSRSFYYFRLGVSFKKITLGIGANLDYYGKDKIDKQNFGGFLRVNI